MIQAVFYLLDISFCQMFKAAAFGDILPNQSIDVLIQPSLPGAIGVAEVVIAFELFGNALMFGKLQSVIGGDGMHVSFVRTQEAYDLIGDQFGCFAAGNRELEIHGLSLHDGYNSTLPSFADNRIDFEVSQSCFLLDYERPVIDTDPACNTVFTA